MTVRSKLVSVGVVAGLVGGLTLVSTTAATTEPAGGDDGCTEERVGGEITVSARGMAQTLDTYTSDLATIQTSYDGIPIYDLLMRYDLESGTYVPNVAESLEPNDDATEWTLTLREGVEFGNGDPLDADAMIAHLDRHLAADSTSRARYSVSDSIASYEKVDGMTVTFALSYPWGGFPALFTGSLGQVINVAVIDERGEAFATDPTGAGVGPYEVTEYSPPERIVYEAKSDWWGGPVCIEKITLVYIPDQRANYDAYQQGEVDVMYSNRDPELLADMEADNPGQLAGQIFNTAFMVMPNVGANGYTGPTSDLRIRQAIAMAIDPEVVNQRAWGGLGWPSRTLVQEESQLLTPTGGPTYDPDAARALVEEYVAETGWDGHIEGIAAGFPASNKEAAITIAAQLEAVGIHVDLNTDLGVVDLITRITVDKDFELVMSWGIIQSENTLDSGLRNFMSTSPLNQNGFASEAFDAAIGEMRSATDTAAYQAGVDSLQQVVDEEVPFIVYGADRGSTMTRETIQGITWHNAIDPLFDDAWVDAG